MIRRSRQFLFGFLVVRYFDVVLKCLDLMYEIRDGANVSDVTSGRTVGMWPCDKSKLNC